MYTGGRGLIIIHLLGALVLWIVHGFRKSVMYFVPQYKGKDRHHTLAIGIITLIMILGLTTKIVDYYADKKDKAMYEQLRKGQDPFY